MVEGKALDAKIEMFMERKAAAHPDIFEHRQRATLLSRFAARRFKQVHPLDLKPTASII